MNECKCCYGYTKNEEFCDGYCRAWYNMEMKPFLEEEKNE